MRIAYPGPAGTFTEDALHDALGGREADLLPEPTVYDAIEAVAEGRADRALVPFENSLEGSVRATLDTLAFEIPTVTIVGEHDQQISHSLIARRGLALSEITAVLSHPQASAAKSGGTIDQYSIRSIGSILRRKIPAGNNFYTKGFYKFKICKLSACAPFFCVICS